MRVSGNRSSQRWPSRPYRRGSQERKHQEQAQSRRPRAKVVSRKCEWQRPRGRTEDHAAPGDASNGSLVGSPIEVDPHDLAGASHHATVETQQQGVGKYQPRKRQRHDQQCRGGQNKHGRKQDETTLDSIGQPTGGNRHQRGKSCLQRHQQQGLKSRDAEPVRLHQRHLMKHQPRADQSCGRGD